MELALETLHLLLLLLLLYLFVISMCLTSYYLLSPLHIVFFFSEDIVSELLLYLSIMILGPSLLRHRFQKLIYLNKFIELFYGDFPPILPIMSIKLSIEHSYTACEPRTYLHCNLFSSLYHTLFDLDDLIVFSSMGYHI